MSHLPFGGTNNSEHSNEVGFKNVTGEQVKEFQKHLSKFIKYEENLSVNHNKDNKFNKLNQIFTKIFHAKMDNAKATQQEQQEQKEPKEQPRHHHKSTNCKSKEIIILRPKAILRESGQTLDNYNFVPTTPTSPPQPTTSKNALKEVATTSKIEEKPKQQEKMEDHSSGIHDLQCLLHKDLQIAPDPAPAVPPVAANRRRMFSRDPLFRNQPQYFEPTPELHHFDRLKRRGRSQQRPLSVDRLPSHPAEAFSGNNMRRTKSSIIARGRSKNRRGRPNDPVALYLYYQSEWNHFRRQMPL